VTFLVGSEEDAHALGDALGIGHDGLGAVSWPIGKSDRSAAFWWCLVALIVAAVLGLAAAEGVLIGWLLFRRVSGLFDPGQASRSLSLDATCVQILPGRYTYGYGAIADARADEGGLTLVPEGGGQPAQIFVERRRLDASSASAEELVQIAAHVRAASQRAHGFGRQKKERSVRVDILARGNDSVPAWHARLDATAASVSAGAGGYRGGGVAEDDLWETLRDPDAPPDLRAGAARVLVRIAPETAPARVGSVLATVRAPDEEAEIREAIADAADEQRAARR
jgi:hypothetical protein